MTHPPIDVDVLVDLQDFLADFDEEQRRALNLSPIFAGKVDQIVTAFLTKRFDTEGAHLGTKWQKLSKRTLQARKGNGRGRGGILWDQGIMRGSLVKSGGPGSIREISDTMYRRGTTDPKAAIHQRGGTIRRTAKVKADMLQRRRAGGRRGMGAGLKRYSITIPARPIIPEPVPQALLDEITKAITDWLAKGQTGRAA
jgi:hypothetical protein